MQSAVSATAHSPRCRICYDSTDNSPGLGRLIRPCNCNGTVALVHEGCLSRWLESTGSTTCELCHSEFEVISCHLKDLSAMTWPHPLEDDFLGRFEFFFLWLWLFDMISLLSKIAVHGGTEALKMHVEDRFGTGCLFYVGSFCTAFDMIFYGAVFVMVMDQWLRENSVFVLHDRNSPREREAILDKINRSKTLSYVTCKERLANKQ